MVAEAVADLHQLVLRGIDECGQIGERAFDEVGPLFVGVPGGHVLQQAHGVEGVEDVGRSVDELGPFAGERRGLESAAELFDFFVESADAKVGMQLFEAGELFVEHVALGLPHGVPDRDHTACVALAATAEAACEADESTQCASSEHAARFQRDCEWTDVMLTDASLATWRRDERRLAANVARRVRSDAFSIREVTSTAPKACRRAVRLLCPAGESGSPCRRRGRAAAGAPCWRRLRVRSTL